MRRPVLIVLIAALAVLAVVAGVFFNKYQKTSSELAASRASEQQSSDRYTETIDAIAEIQDSLNAIALGDTGVGVQPWRRGGGPEAAPPTGQEALDRIAAMRASIARSKDRIAQLESSLKRSGNRVAGLQRMVDNLKQSVQDKETVIARLANRVDELKVQVTGLETTVAQAQDTLRVKEHMLEERRRELATVYYVAGTKKELTEAGVVRERGGVLGIGQTLQPSPSPNTAVFTPVDTDMQTVIQVDAPKIKILSAQPATSYYVQRVGERTEIHIVDPNEFRKIKQLVILEA